MTFYYVKETGKPDSSARKFTNAKSACNHAARMIQDVTTLVIVRSETELF